MSSSSLPDLLAENLDVVFCGLNPSLGAVRTGHHFESRSNRFWRVLHFAGFTPTLLDAKEDRRLLDYGCGLTTVAPRPTPAADALTRDDYLAAVPVLEAKIRAWRPRAAAFLGKPGYAALTGRRRVDWGAQCEMFGGACAWVLPNPSGRNRSFSLAQLVRVYRSLRETLDGAHGIPW